jgi:hypothetical protein
MRFRKISAPRIFLANYRIGHLSWIVPVHPIKPKFATLSTAYQVRLIFKRTDSALPGGIPGSAIRGRASAQFNWFGYNEMEWILACCFSRRAGVA